MQAGCCLVLGDTVSLECICRAEVPAADFYCHEWRSEPALRNQAIPMGPIRNPGKGFPVSSQKAGGIIRLLTDILLGGGGERGGLGRCTAEPLDSPMMSGCGIHLLPHCWSNYHLRPQTHCLQTRGSVRGSCMLRGGASGVGTELLAEKLSRSMEGGCFL